MIDYVDTEMWKVQPAKRSSKYIRLKDNLNKAKPKSIDILSLIMK